MLTPGVIVSDRYLVESIIGTGGMANVYKAYDRIEKRSVALKVLKEEHRNDSEFVRRFEREAKAVLSLHHENIVSSYDVGEENGLSYIVLEYVEGSTLKDIIKSDGALPPKIAVNIACQVLDALSHAHEAGIIHRDVKPQNVIITPRGKARLTDFGIARDAASTTRTFAGSSVIGTVQYISPEQARGENVTAASDIYSCAIMLYEMLTGEVPFAGDNSVAIALKHLQEDITPPREVNARIPRSLSEVVEKAASKSVRARYSTARQMKADLQRSLREPNGRFARPNDEDAQNRNKGQHRSVVNISIMLIIVLGLFTAMFFIARAIKDQTDDTGADYIIPMLTGKYLEKAQELATLRGFVVTEDEERPFNEEYDEGVVVEQSPTAGTKAKEGDEIYVVVSGGSNYVSVPTLTGSTIQEALVAISDMELSLNTPTYITSDLPAGQIIRQEPAAGVETFKGDVIDIWVSGTPGESEEMPNLTNIQLDVALSMLTEDGFKSFMIFPSTPDELCANENVFKQNPTAGISVALDAKIELWVCRSDPGRYSADIAFNLDIASAQSNVIVTAVTGEGVETVIYTTTSPVGNKQSISFTGYLLTGGDYECCVYVDGEMIKSTVVTFKLA